MPSPFKGSRFHFGVVKDPATFRANLDSKKIVLKPTVDRILDGQSVQFTDNSIAQYDAIILCTGYVETEVPITMDPSLLPVYPARHLNLYQRVIHPQYPTLCYIGCVETAASFTAIEEMQARWIAKIFAGKTTVPSRELMTNELQAENKAIADGTRRYLRFVNYVEYMDFMAEQVGCSPKVEEHPSIANMLKEGPVFPYVYRLSGYGKSDTAKEIMAKL